MKKLTLFPVFMSSSSTPLAFAARDQSRAGKPAAQGTADGTRSRQN